MFRFAGGVALTFFAAICNAQSACTPIRLDAPRGPLNGVQVINQGSVNLCQAAAAADLINAQLSYSTTQRTPARISYVALALGAHTLRGSETVMDDIGPHQILNAARELPGCPDSTVEALVTRETQNLCRGAQIMAAALVTGEIGRLTSTQVCQPPPFKANQNFPDNTESEILRQIFSAPSASLADLNNHVSVACRRNSINMSMLPPASFVAASSFPSDRRNKEMQAAIDRVLDRAEPMPVGMRYCGKVLQDRSSDTVNPASGKISSKCRGEFHASAIIGRRQGPQSCEYLIKNSWGKSCSGYDKSWDCEGGKVWVSYEALIRNLGSLFWLNEK